MLHLLKETGMTDCKPVETPVDFSEKLDPNSDKCLVDKGRYQYLVGRLIYLSCTRPDIAFAASRVREYMHSLNEIT